MERTTHSAQHKAQSVRHAARSASRGLTLVEVIVGVFVMTVVFLGIFGAFKLSIELVFSTKARLGAVSLLGERMEYIRSLPYEDVGTAGGIPAGIIPQVETASLNGTPYTVRTLVLYTDAPEDGLGALDENGITADYKTAKVEVAWAVKNISRSTALTSILTPRGVETLDSGGTLDVRVLDALAAPVPQASVRVVNASTNPAIDVTVLTNDGGAASFPGTPEASDYEIRVSKTGYSSAQTYSVTTENPSPSPGNVSVVDQTTSTVTLFIDRLGSLSFSTFEPVGDGAFVDLFADQSLLLATSSVETSAGNLVLVQDSPGVYAPLGSATSQAVAPLYLVSWNELSLQYATPPGTGALIHLYYFDGASYVLVPDEVLPGNAAGLPSGTHSLAGLSIETYASLRIGAELSSSDSAATPGVFEWSVSYMAGPTPLPNVEFDIRGDKSIGFNAGGAPIYKYTNTFTTSALGKWLLETMEWDRYFLFLTGAVYDIVELCPSTINLVPGASQGVSVHLTNGTPHSLRVVVESAGVPVSGASVALSGPSSGNETTSPCGQAYFGGLSGATYTLSVTKAGFAPWTEQVAVNGDTTATALLSPSGQ